MSTDSTILQLLSAGSAASMAIAAPSVRPLTYGELRDQVTCTVGTLNGFGVGRNDRVAIVLPNGPEMATAFVGIAAGASAAPLNPVYRIEEFEFYLSDLGAKALVLEQGSQSPARQVALRLGMLVLELKTDSDPGRGAGAFTLCPVSAAPETTGSGGFAQAGDVALLLHTSGTTSRPKLVPLTQRNVVASAGSIRDTLKLTAEDRGLNVMPLFHIHGLMAGLLAPLAAGSQVCCTPGFNALKFFGWMQEARPTWYTAVPTMHQTILARAAPNREVIAANPLRFVRSSSSSMPPQVIGELEATFHAPLIEAYGMTEASHQMASNPLPPGKTGEIVIRGENVTPGYEKNPGANAEAFNNGWFRTGDQGIMSAEGYITITGRLKEIIIRGGEKISPREVDEVLMDHPAILQVVTFAFPHDRLGEDVAAAIVLRDGASLTEKEVREFAARRLADFKVPRKVRFVAEIPKGATGKLQRIGLAAKLGLG